MDNKQKQDWISNKIGILIREGYSRDQAYVIAKSMAEGKKMQTGGQYGPNLSNTGRTYNTFMDYYNPQNTPESYSVFDQYPAPPTEQRQPVQSVNSLTPSGLTQNPLPQADPLTQQDITNYEYTQEQLRRQREQEGFDATTQEKIGVYNPYAGVDIPSASVYFGQALENDDTMGAIGSGLKVGLGVARNVFSGIGIQRRNNALEQEARENYQDQRTRATYLEEGGTANTFPFSKPINRYQEGGTNEIDSAKLRTGEFLTGVSENNTTVEPNAEIEDSEYLLTQDGQSAKVIGKTHEQGGEDVELKDGDMIISDHLKVGGETAKLLRDEYDINLKAKNTYAEAVDKIYSKIGLSKLIKEEEALLKKIEKQEEDTKDEPTKNLNLEFLYKQRDKILQEKQNLEPERLGALKQIFTLQEDSKPKQEVKQEQFQQGGQMQNPYDYTKENGEPQTLSPYAYVMFEGTPEEKAFVEADMAKYFDPNGEFYEANRRQESAQEHLDRMRPIYESQKNGGLNTIDQMQQTPLIRAMRAEIEGGPISKEDSAAFAIKHKLDVDTAHNILEEFRNGGKKLPKYQDGTISSIPVEGDTQSINETKLFGEQNFAGFEAAKEANPWYDWTGFDPTNPEDVAEYQKAFNGRVTSGPRLDVDGKWGIETAGARFIGREETEAVIPTETTQTTTEEDDVRSRINIPLGPDQSVLPPSAVTSQLALDRDYDRVRPQLVSTEALVQENERVAQSAYDAIDVQGLTGAARAAAIASVANNTQAANAQAIFRANLQNTQIQNRAEAQNAQIQMAEENAEAQDVLGYERRIQTGQAIAEENLRNYMDYNRKLNVARFNDIRRQNTINELFENYTINADGTISVTGVDDDYLTRLTPQQRAQIAQQQIANSTKTTKK